MSRLYIAAALAALGFFSYAQQQGMSVFGARGTQQLASSGGSSGGFARSGSLSHK